MVFLEQAKKKYPGEWLAFQVQKELQDGGLKGRIIEHQKDRKTLYRKLEQKKIDQVYVTYAGPVVPTGYGILF